MWADRAECQEIIESSWRDTLAQLNLQNMMDNVNTCSSKLEVWSTKNFNLVRKKSSKSEAAPRHYLTHRPNSIEGRGNNKVSDRGTKLVEER